MLAFEPHHDIELSRTEHISVTTGVCSKCSRFAIHREPNKTCPSDTPPAYMRATGNKPQAHARAPLSTLNHLNNEENTMASYQLGRQAARMGFMNKAIARAVKSLAIRAGLLMLFAVASAAHASPPNEVADVIRTARTATSAEVFIVPTYGSPPISINQDMVPQYGCRYAVDRNNIRGLLAIIDKAAIEKADTRDATLDLNIMIKLHNSDGVFATLAFKKFASSLDDKVHGLVNGIDATAAADLPERLRAWATGLGPPTHSKYTSCP